MGIPWPIVAYRSPLREARARETRRRVLAAATAQFLERGWAGTTVRGVAAASGVSVPTVEQLFGTKRHLLTAAIDVAIAGDDEPVPVLDRPWVDAAARARTPRELLAVAAPVLAAAQARSASLVLALFEAARTYPDLAAPAAERARQREATAAWLVDALARLTPVTPGAVDTLWILMDPALYDRLTRMRGWSRERYAEWFADSARRLLVPDTHQEDLP